ncbi:transcriptional protein SWT1 [Tribolium madens]|uniref:transcriptional protein SWT1 n=1 Tax=Tribolium madens TaxID=41895 RepID=UPI001CF72EEA|nr:transcriptional protein SWT1 [Tribolium madens]
MSDKRKVLVAKRKNERNPKNFAESCRIVVQNDNNFKRGTKRPIIVNTPKKNLANDRLKRLRTTLNEEVKNSSQPLSNSKDKNCVRKRPTCSVEHEVSTKWLKENDSGAGECSKTAPPFIFKEEFLTQKSVFTAVSPNPFAVLDLQQQSENKAENMEWSPTDDESSISASDSTFNTQVTSSSGGFYIVVDTNIFLSHLKIIADIITMTVKGPREPIIFVPWIVTEELDFIKGDSNKRNLRQKAQDAIKFIEKTMSSKHQRLKGQTLMEANEQKSVGINQDNKIIACCMQVLEKYENMILLTNDINLKNKAHFNNIPVCSSQEIILKILQAQNNSKAENILNIMTSLCNTVIYECAKNAYGEACKKMPICQPLPKTLNECIAIFTKYWFPVFQEVLMKQFKNAIEHLSVFLSKHITINDKSKELNNLVRLCVRTCLFLKDVECCKNIIENTIRDLNNLKES